MYVCMYVCIYVCMYVCMGFNGLTWFNPKKLELSLSFWRTSSWIFTGNLQGNWICNWQLPSGTPTQSPCFLGKSTINDPFSVAFNSYVRLREGTASGRNYVIWDSCTWRSYFGTWWGFNFISNVLIKHQTVLLGRNWDVPPASLAEVLPGNPPRTSVLYNLPDVRVPCQCVTCDLSWWRWETSQESARTIASARKEMLKPVMDKWPPPQWKSWKLGNLENAPEKMGGN